MPVGSFFSDPAPTRTRSTAGGSSFGDQLTGPGPASQPRSTGNTLLGPAPLGGQTMPMGSQTTPNYGYGAQPTQTRLNPNIGSWAMDAARTQLSSSNQLAQQAVGTTPSLAGYRSLLDTFYGPQSQLLGQTLARQQDQYGLIPIEADYRRGALERDTDLSRRGLDLDRANVGLDRQALGIEAGATRGNIANLDKLRAILGKQFGLEGEDLNNKLKQLGIDEAKLKDMAGRQKFDLRSNLTARGAFNTVANDRGTGRIDRDLIYGLGGIANQRTAADIAHRGNVLGLQEKGIGYNNQGIALGARLANIGVDNARLDNALSRIGLNEEGLGNALTDGLRAIGLDEYTSLNSLLDAIGGTNVQQAELSRTILDALIGYSGLPPDVAEALIAGWTRGSATPTAPTGSADPTRNL